MDIPEPTYDADIDYPDSGSEWDGMDDGALIYIHIAFLKTLMPTVFRTGDISWDLEWVRWEFIGVGFGAEWTSAVNIAHPVGRVAEWVSCCTVEYG